jgi:hypothetical protein
MYTKLLRLIETGKRQYPTNEMLYKVEFEINGIYIRSETVYTLEEITNLFFLSIQEAAAYIS